MTLDTKTALLDSAEHAARTHGFNGFSYADLAKEVGIRKASIHHHFPTKASLSVALMERYFDNFIKIRAEIDTLKGSGAERLKSLIEIYRDALEGGRRVCLCVAFSASPENLSKDVIAQIAQFRQAMGAWLVDVFTLGQIDGSIVNTISPHSEAAATLSLLEGAHLAARVKECISPFDDATHLLKMRLA